MREHSWTLTLDRAGRKNLREIVSKICQFSISFAWMENLRWLQELPMGLARQ
jgi:hypothetical protein